MATARWLHHVQPHVSYILGPESCSSTFLTVDDSERSDAFGWKFIDPDGPNREGTGSGACAQPEPWCSARARLLNQEPLGVASFVIDERKEQKHPAEMTLTWNFGTLTISLAAMEAVAASLVAHVRT